MFPDSSLYSYAFVFILNPEIVCNLRLTFKIGLHKLSACTCNKETGSLRSEKKNTNILLTMSQDQMFVMAYGSLQFLCEISIYKPKAITLWCKFNSVNVCCKPKLWNWNMSGLSVKVSGSAWGAFLTKSAHTSLALSVRRKESYTWNHSWSPVSGYRCAEPGLAGFLPSKSFWPLPKHNTHFVHIQCHWKGRHAIRRR